MRTTVTLASGAIQPAIISIESISMGNKFSTSEETTTAFSEICLFDAICEILVVVTNDFKHVSQEVTYTDLSVKLRMNKHIHLHSSLDAIQWIL